VKWKKQTIIGQIQTTINGIVIYTQKNKLKNIVNH